MTTPNPGLTHVGDDGATRMVDVGEKAVTRRHAVVEAFVKCSTELLDHVRAHAIAKGNLVEVARIAGIQAAKRTDELIPLCHGLPLEVVSVDIAIADAGFAIRAEARTSAKTGVEMEAFTAATVAALTIIDMGKAVDRGMTIERVRLIEKSGGRSGDYKAEGVDR